MSSKIRNYSLSLAMLGLFMVSMVGQILSGHSVFNQELEDHDQPPVSVSQYVRSSHFVEATFENWESEFLQMAAFVLLTAVLIQKGSSESKSPKEGTVRKKDKRSERTAQSPG